MINPILGSNWEMKTERKTINTITIATLILRWSMPNRSVWGR